MDKNENVRFITSKAADTPLVNDIYKLRVICRNDGGYITFEKYPDGWFDEMDNYAIHVAGFTGNELVCSMRLVLLNSLDEHPYYNAFKNNSINLSPGRKCAYLSRACVNPSHRGKGNFERMMNYSYEFSKLIGYNIFFGDADVEMTKTYEKMGWEKIGNFDSTAIKWDLNIDGQSFISFEV